MLELPNMIDGITTTEATILRKLLLSIRTIKPFETLEIKLHENQPGIIAVHLKSNYKETFELDKA